MGYKSLIYDSLYRRSSHDNKMILNTHTDLLSLALLLQCIRRLVCLSHGRSEFLEYFILEEEPRNTFVGDLASDARLVDKHGMDILKQLRFHFVSSAPSLPHRKLFHLSPETGVLSTADTVDRETACESRITECTVGLDVYVTPTAYFEIIKIQLHILDVNDNSPRFPVAALSISVPEESPPGALFPLPAATDPDHGHNSVQGYFLSEQRQLGSGADRKFGVRAVNRTKHHQDIYLEVLLPLDRESSSSHSLILVASDAGYPVRTGNITLNITVLDDNDNAPQFTQEVYEFHVSENQPPGTTIGKVSANDLDEGVNSEIRYAVVESGITSEDGHPFLVDSESGWVTVTGDLDFERQQYLMMTVTAIDHGHRQRTGFSQVFVRILDENDNAPQVSLHLFGGEEGRAEVAENQAKGSFVAHISVSDKDSGHNGEFRCGVRGLRGYIALIQLSSPTEFKLVTTSELDREVSDSHEVTVICSDNGPQPLSTSVTFPIRVIDVNDNDPRFGQDVYSVEIFENNEIGTSLVRIAASDADVDNNSAIFYDVIKTDDVRGDIAVAVDAVNGDISAAMVFDREERASYEYTLVAYDRGVPQRSSTASLKIIVRDLNDEIPKFTQRRYIFEIVENEPKDTEIGKVTAGDLDLPPFNDVTYVIDRSDEDGAKFRVNENSGSIYARFSFDREERDFYQFAVFAQDVGLSSNKSVATVIIYVLDVNDNAPTFLFPCLANNTIQMMGTDVAPGTIAGTISAFDLDAADQNGNLSFSLVSGNGSEVFDVDDDTGHIFVRPTYTPTSSIQETIAYQLDLRVSDGGQPSLDSTASLFILISHSSESPTGSGNEDMSVVIGLAVFFGVSAALVSFWLIVVKILLDRHEKVHSASFTANSKLYASAVQPHAAQRLISSDPHELTELFVQFV